MIPKFTQSGVLPPYQLDADGGPTNRGAVSPYNTSLISFAQRFGNNAHRQKLLRGFLKYRIALKEAGITEGFQWVDGSFTEDIENFSKRYPNDIDLVTFVRPPAAEEGDVAWREFVDANPLLFNPVELKQEFHCDAYLVSLIQQPEHLVAASRYWFGLFSHRRDTSIWKGMLEISLCYDEAEVLEWLDKERKDAT